MVLTGGFVHNVNIITKDEILSLHQNELGRIEELNLKDIVPAKMESEMVV